MVINEEGQKGNCSQLRENCEIDCSDLRSVFNSHKILCGLIVLLFSLGAFLRAMSLPNIYTAQAVLAPVNDTAVMRNGLGAFDGLASLAGFGGTSGSEVTTNIAIIKSRSFIIEFIKENELMPFLFADMWDAEVKEWMVPKEENYPTFMSAYRLFSKELLSISVDRKTKLINISISWINPELASEWVAKFVSKANLYLKNKAIDEASLSVDYLQKQLSETDEVGVRSLLYKLLEKEIQTVKLANARKEFAFKVLDPPLVPERKSKPNRTMICVTGVISGVVFAIFVMFLVSIYKANMAVRTISMRSES